MLTETTFHLGIISVIFLSVWAYSLKGKWVSDDWQGLAKFSDSLKVKGRKCRQCKNTWSIEKEDIRLCPTCKIDSNDNFGDLVDSYEEEVNKTKKVKFKNTQFNPHLGIPSSVVRWIRLNLGKSFRVLGKNKKGHEVWGYVQNPVKHHIINLAVQLTNCFLAYFLLAKLFSPELAFYTVLLFSVHPLSAQTVAWCSGLGYLLCLLWTLLTLNLVLYSSNLFLTVHGVGVLSFLATYGLFSGAFNWVMLAYLGYWIPAAVSFAVFGITLVQWGMKIVRYRKSQFESQNMGRSTYFNLCKPIVMVKTLLYYMCMTVFPRSLGLFHKWGYHYEESLEKANPRFFLGLLAITGLAFGFYHGSEPIRLGILWWLLYLAVFSNFITAMQFIADRYGFISSFGYSLIVATLLKDYPLLMGVAIGGYAVRTLLHLPTFNDEVSFYRSNAFNFPTSEVALGNLGVTYMNRGKAGSAVDTWFDAVKLNPHYDVPHYNLYSVFKSNGQVQIAYQHLKNCLNSKVVHFDKHWGEEMKRMEGFIQSSKSLEQHALEINKKVEGK